MNLEKIKEDHTIREVCGALYVDFMHPGYSDLGHDLDFIKTELLNLPWETKRTARHEYFMSDPVLCGACEGFGQQVKGRCAPGERGEEPCDQCGGAGSVPRTYSYGNKGMGSETYHSKPFTTAVRHLMKSINSYLGTELNVCFLNKYDDQHNHLGWHADNFADMRADQPIVVVSFGAEREIWLKDKRGFRCASCPDEPGCRPHPNPASGYKWMHCGACRGTGWHPAPPNGKQPADQRIKLEEASLFIMPPGYQDTHQHRIPKHDRPCGWRISLTFRSFS